MVKYIMKDRFATFIHNRSIWKSKTITKNEGVQKHFLATTYALIFGSIIFLSGIQLILYNNKYMRGVVVLDPDKSIRNVSDKFLSIALDTELIKNGWIHSNISSIKLLQAASALAPAYLRLGGTAADLLLFVPNPSDKQLQNKALQLEETKFINDKSCVGDGLLCYQNMDNFIMSGEEWLQINQFAKSAELDLLFDLNVLLRDGTNWNSTNAQELLKFSDEHNFEVAWQLGNEPNSFQHVFHTEVSGEQLSNDFKTLRKLLHSFPRYNGSTLVGPDITRPKFLEEEAVSYLKKFVQEIGTTINAVTWHQYYLNGRTATYSEFINPDTLNVLIKQIDAIKEVVAEYLPNTPIWLTETSSAYGGGAPGLSDRFVAGFLWLDKLGIAAEMGIDVVVRQTLYNGHYSLLDKTTLDPLPDWWLSVLYKTFVGQRVLKLENTGAQSGHIRLYCHCTAQNTLHSAVGAVTIFGMNLNSYEAKIQVEGLPKPSPSTSEIFAYSLTGEAGLISKTVLLNGERLQLRPDGSLPPFRPVITDIDTPLTLPPLSMGFWVLYGVHVTACAS